MVVPYLMLYAATWLYNGGTEDLAGDFLPVPAQHGPGQGIPVQVLHSSVQTTFKTIRDVFIAAPSMPPSASGSSRPTSCPTSP